jgi:predicted amidohydrolase
MLAPAGWWIFRSSRGARWVRAGYCVPETANSRNVALILRAGALVGVYAKAYPNEPGIEAGTDMPVFEAGGSRVAVNICNDANYPALAQRARQRGASVLCYPLNNMLRPATAERWRERSIGNLVARARETGCWVVSSDVTGTCGGQVSFGCTAIVSPAGEIVARAPESETGRILLDLLLLAAR